MTPALVLIAFLLIFIIIGLYAGKKITHKDAEGYFMGDRSLNRWQIGISAGATANSGFIVVGAVGMGYGMGLSALLYPLAWLLGDLVFWYLFAERIRTNEAVRHAVTVPQALSYGDNNALLRVTAGMVVLLLLAVYASAQFIASAKVVASFTDLSSQTSLLVSFIFVMAYTAWGGFKSSVYTDILQGVMMLFLTAGVLLWGVIHIGGIDAMTESFRRIGGSFLDLSGGKSLGALVAFSLGFSFTAFGFSMSQPQVITRIFAAHDEKEVKAARWIYISFLHFTWMGMVLIGMVAKVLLPDLSDPEAALPLMAKEFFSPLFVGFVFAGMVATILSSVDSMLVSSASAFSVDFGIDKRIETEKRMLLYRFTVLFIGGIALMLAIFLQSTVFQIIIFAVSVMTASIGAAMLLKVLDLVSDSRALLVTMVVGMVTAILWKTSGWDAFVNEGFAGGVIGILAGWLAAKKIR